MGYERHENGHESSGQEHLRHAPPDIPEKRKLPAPENEMESQPGNHKCYEQDTEKNGDVEIEQPPSGIQERLGTKGTIDKEESHEKKRRSKEIPYLHRQPPEYVRDLFHIGMKSRFVVFHPKYSILIPETSDLSHFLIPHTTCFHDRKAESNFAPEKLMET